MPPIKWPIENWSKLPHSLSEDMDKIETLGEAKVIWYIVRHTIGFHDKRKRITLDEFQYGRKRKDGTRMDRGTGLSKPTLIDGIMRAVEHEFLQVETTGDKARRKNVYSLLYDEDENYKESLPFEDENGKESLPNSEESQNTNGKEVLPIEQAKGKESLPSQSQKGKTSLPRSERDTYLRDTSKYESHEVRAAGPRASPDAPRNKGPTVEAGNGTTEHQRFFGAIARAFKMDRALMTNAQRGRVNRYARQVRAAGYTTRQIELAARNWWNTWPGNTGSPPNDGQFSQRLKLIQEQEARWKMT